MPNKPKVTDSTTEASLNPIDMPLPASYTGGTRSASQIKIVVLHDSEIAGGPDYLQQLHDVLAAQSLSVHVGVNSDGTCARMEPDTAIAYHVTEYNDIALGIEQAGFYGKNYTKAEEETTAKWIAYWCTKYNIPFTHSISHGVCMHSDLGAAGGGHIDPGPTYPFNEVLKKAASLAGKVVMGGEGETTGTTTTATGEVTGGVSLQAVEAAAKAASFSAYLELPGIFDSLESMALKGTKSLMNDQPLMPFIEQLTKSSLRRFQSMPNGNFYAFYPDYFGGMNHRTPYWEVEDIEIIDGKMNLSDDALATHVYIVGDTVGMWNGINIEDQAASSGVVTLFQAMACDFITGTGMIPAENEKGKEKALKSKQQVIHFLQKYGARPYYEEAPMVRSGYYEMFLAYQRFCMLWSKQFEAEFQLTFMPEIFPGGLIAFPNHGIQLFVEAVEHDMDYENGFTTNVLFSCPAALKGGPNGIHDGMIRADALT